MRVLTDFQCYPELRTAVPQSTVVPTQDMKGRKLSDHLHELHRENGYNVEIVLFPGFQYKEEASVHDYLETWTMKNSKECWLVTLLPRIFTDSEAQCRLRVLSVSYQGMLDLKDQGTDSSDEYLISENLLMDLIRLGNVGQSHDVPVIFLGHDVGGFLIKKFVVLVDNKLGMECQEDIKKMLTNFLGNLKGVFFYATPHSGSVAIDKRAKCITESSRNQMLRLMMVLNKVPARTNADFNKIRLLNGINTFAIHPIFLTNQGGFANEEVVSEGSSRQDIDDFHTVQADHFEVCQAENESSTVVRQLKNYVLKVVQATSKRPPTFVRSLSKKQKRIHPSPPDTP